MRKRFSIYHFLIAIMMFSLVLPAGVANAWSNDAPKGSLTIHKYEQDPKKDQGNNNPDGDGSKNQDAEGEPLEGVIFTLTQTHSYDPISDEWTEFEGEPFSETTDEYGKIVINNIDLGRYKVQEVDGPDHVNLNEEEYFVDIPMTSKDGTDLNYDVHIYPKNETIRGSVELTKVDGDSEKALKGVKFKLFDEEGYVKTLLTKENGKITVDNLAYGNYYFKEITPQDGYVLGNQNVEFKIENSNKTVKLNVENYKEPDFEKTVNEPAVNRGDTVTYTLNIGLPGDASEYNSFVVTDILDDNLEFISEDSPSHFVFNKNNQTLTWTVEDMSQLNTDEVTITFEARVSEEAPIEIDEINNEATINLTNQYDQTAKPKDNTTVDLTEGDVRVIKVDASDNEKTLSGAEFKLTDEDGNTINADGTIITVNGEAQTGKLENLTTNADGEFTIENLNVGTYYLHETKAPTYETADGEKSYRMLTKPIEVKVKDKETTEVSVKNSKSDWELPKTGGIGTTLFTFVGLIFMGAAGYMYIKRRRGEVS